MEKTCPKCGKSFECRHDLSCDCMKVRLGSQARQYVAGQYPGQCLCPDCLRRIAGRFEEPEEQAMTRG